MLFTKSGFCKEFYFFEVYFSEFNPNFDTKVKRRNVKSTDIRLDILIVVILLIRLMTFV